MNTNLALSQKQTDTVSQFANFLVDGVFDKKAQNVVLLDLRELPEAVCDFFVICEGTSATHVKAIADSAAFKVKKELGQLPLSTEGTNTSEWVLIDYFDVVVHVFLKEKREFYQLEELWSDAKFTRFNDSGKIVA